MCVCVDMSPTDYRVDNESLLIGGEVCLWTEYADDDSIMPRLWSADLHCLLLTCSIVLCLVMLLAHKPSLMAFYCAYMKQTRLPSTG